MTPTRLQIFAGYGVLDGIASRTARLSVGARVGSQICRTMAHAVGYGLPLAAVPDPSQFTVREAS